jgi:CRISPR type IV-associated protein Csf1
MQHQTISTNKSSSQLYAGAVGLKGVGTPLKSAAVCAMCAAKLKAGDLALPVGDHFGESFNNKLDMHHEGDVLCGACKALWSKDFLQNNSKSYADASGVYSLASNDNIAAFVLTPPTVPFVAIYNTRKQQHMIWRTPVCYSDDVMIVRHDDELLYIRRDLALAGARAWRKTLACMEKIGMKGMPGDLALSLGLSGIGKLRKDVVLAVTQHSAEGAEAIATLQKLRMGELWVLTSLRNVDQDAPQTWPKPAKLFPQSEAQLAKAGEKAAAKAAKDAPKLALKAKKAAELAAEKEAKRVKRAAEKAVRDAAKAAEKEAACAAKAAQRKSTK